MNRRTIFAMSLTILALGLLAFLAFASSTGGFLGTPTPTMTNTATLTNTATFTNTSTLTFTPSMTATPTVTQTFTSTLTATNTLAPLWTPTKKRRQADNNGPSVTLELVTLTP